MKISVIVPIFNRLDNLKKVFTCLSRQVIQPQHTVKIILVDDGSDDGTANWVTNYHHLLPFTYIKRLREHEWNASKPRNQGARASDVDTDAFYFLDSDVLLPPDRIQRLIDDYLADPDPNRVIIGPYHYMNQPIEVDEGWYEREIRNYAQDMRWRSFEEHPVEEKNTGIGFALSFFGGSVMVPKDLFWKVKGFDENCVAGVEDGSMGLSLLKAGAVFSLDKGLLGWHNYHQILPERTARIEEMKKYINIKHFGTENPDYGILEATREAYGSWGFDWHDPKWEGKHDKEK